MQQRASKYEVVDVDVYEEYCLAKADALEWYKRGGPHRSYRPRTMRYRSGKKVIKRKKANINLNNRRIKQEVKDLWHV